MSRSLLLTDQSLSGRRYEGLPSRSWDSVIGDISATSVVVSTSLSPIFISLSYNLVGGIVETIRDMSKGFSIFVNI